MCSKRAQTVAGEFSSTLSSLASSLEAEPYPSDISDNDDPKNELWQCQILDRESLKKMWYQHIWTTLVRSLLREMPQSSITNLPAEKKYFNFN